VLTAFLLARQVKGAIVLGILLSTAVAFAWGITEPATLLPPDFSIIGQADVRAALAPRFLPLLLAILMVDFFDTLGTVTAISEQANLVDKEGRVSGLRNILLVDSASASIGGWFGVSSVTSYIESAAGVADGARTGLHSVFVGLFFLVAVLVAPLVGIVPLAATAPALILVGFLMCAQIARIDFSNLQTAIPAFITLITVPFTYSIAHGIGYGFITFVAMKVLALRFREVHVLMYAAAGLFCAYFLWGPV